MTPTDIAFLASRMDARQSPRLADSATYGQERGQDDLTPRQARYLAKTPPLSAQIVRRAFLGVASPRVAIKAYCLSCSSWQREEITHCSVETCPLWLYRPYRARPLREG